jgi:hypothetical protein
MKVTISIEEDVAQTTSVVSQGVDTSVEEQEGGLEGTAPIDGGSAPAWLPGGVGTLESTKPRESAQARNGAASADGGVAKALDIFQSPHGMAGSG